MEFSVRHPSPPNTYSYVREESSGSTRKCVAGYLGKYTAHNDYTEEEVRRISIAAAMLVSTAVLEVGGALVSGLVTHMMAYDPEDHDVPNVIE